MAMKGFCFNKYSQFTPTNSSLEMDKNRGHFNGFDQPNSVFFLRQILSTPKGTGEDIRQAGCLLEGWRDLNGEHYSMSLRTPLATGIISRT